MKAMMLIVIGPFASNLFAKETKIWSFIGTQCSETVNTKAVSKYTVNYVCYGKLAGTHDSALMVSYTFNSMNFLSTMKIEKRTPVSAGFSPKIIKANLFLVDAKDAKSKAQMEIEMHTGKVLKIVGATSNKVTYEATNFLPMFSTK